MDGAIPFFLFMFLPPLLIALIAQIFAGRDGTGRVIAWAALGWMGFVFYASRFSGWNSMEAIVTLGVFTVIALVLALAGGIIGSELSTLLKRFLGSHS